MSEVNYGVMTAFDRGTLLITGGTGTFGKATVNAALSSNLEEIRVFSRDEKKQEDMRIFYDNSKLRFVLGDVRDERSCRDAMEGVDYVFHAAALKQVPSCEFFPLEAISTNAIGADNVMRAAGEAGVKKCIVLSTDKAAYPVNAMGISKAMMEKLMVARARVSVNKETTFAATRYGNVMASRGSVIPLLISQILQGRPLTVTDPEMTRFMMFIEEAVDLVLYAFQNAQSGDLFVKKAPSTTVGILVSALLKIFNADNPVRVIGTRHGEKLYETLLTREEMACAVDMGGYYRVPADIRGLNYHSFISEGDRRLDAMEDYHSHNAEHLDLAGTVELLSRLQVVREGLEGKLPL